MGQLLSTLRFDCMTAACGGVVTVRQGDLYGFFGGDGLYAPCVWEDAGIFEEGLAWVRQDGKLGFVSERGERAYPTGVRLSGKRLGNRFTTGGGVC